MKKTIKKSYLIALCAVVCALSVVFMFLTGLIPVGTYALPCIAGMLLAIIVIEAGYGAAVSVYISVSLLGMLIAADKEAVLYYTAFFGLYPILKGLMEKIPSRLLQLILKYSAFNICVITAFYISIYVLMIPKESFVIFGMYLPWVFLLMGNLVFIVYDYAFTVLITNYINKWRNLINRK